MRSFIQRRFPGFSRHARWIRDQIQYSRLQWAKTEFGFEFLGTHSTAENRTDTGEIGVLQDFLPKADVFIDVGANTGFFTLLACQAGVPILCFEPNSDNYKRLLLNLRRNNVKGVEAFFLALTEHPGFFELYGGGEGASLLKGWGGVENTYTQLVATNNLDNLIYKRFESQKLFIKIDVEGHEFSVMSGCPKLLAAENPPIWLLEHGLTNNFAGALNPNYLALFDLFWQHGYTATTADADRRIVSQEDVARWLKRGEIDFGFINYLFTKPQQPN